MPVTIAKSALLCACIFITASSFSQAIPDSALKINAAPINQALQQVLRLQPKSFQYNTARFKQMNLQGGMQFGFMAEEVELVFPHLVKQRYTPYMFGKNTYRNVATSQIDTQALIPVLVASIQELSAELERLKAEIRELRK